MSGLSEQQMAARDGKLTASRVGILMSGDAEKITNLWKELVGDPSFVPEDISGKWPVYLGSHTETLHLDWIERQRGYQLTRRGEVVVHPHHAWASCTLDAWDQNAKAPIETKHVNNFSKPADVVERYMPQLHWQMLCTGSSRALLSMIVGANEPLEQAVELNPEYAAILMGRAHQFWRCVETLTPPVDLPVVAAPVAPEKYRKVDMSGSNSWTEHAANWLANKEAAKTFDKAVDEIKALIEADIGEATGAGVVAKRSKTGAITIKKEK